MTYYEVSRKKKMCGQLNFDLFQGQVTKDSKFEFTVTMKNLDRKFYFRCNSEKLTNEWVISISEQIHNSKGYSQKRAAPQIKDFWKFEIITIDQFYEDADTFDILLFRSNSTGGPLIRTYTNSEFDHVGMILRLEKFPNQVLIFEATNGPGVIITCFSTLKRYVGTFYDKIVLRKLNIDRENFDMSILEQFLKESVGKQYSCNVEKLMRRKTITQPLTNQKSPVSKQRQQSVQNNSTTNNLINKDRTFFCSELIAKCYKVCGIMKESSVSTTQFMPNDFSQEKKSDWLAEGLSFQQEQIILP